MIISSIVNLELLQKFGPNAWRIHNYQLETMHQELEKEVKKYQQKITDLNKKRKLEQVCFYFFSKIDIDSKQKIKKKIKPKYFNLIFFPKNKIIKNEAGATLISLQYKLQEYMGNAFQVGVGVAHLEAEVLNLQKKLKVDQTMDDVKQDMKEKNKDEE